MVGKLIRPTWVTRQDLRDNPTTLYMFGDNMMRQGLGGQAGAMRGEPNSVGVPTKWAPGRAVDDFFTDDVLSQVPQVVIPAIDGAFLRAWHHMLRRGTVAIPADGLGTGLSELPERAPAVLAVIETWIARLTAASKPV